MDGFFALLEARPNGFNLGILGISKSMATRPGRSFFGLAVSSNKSENMMNLAWEILQRDDCDDETIFEEGNFSSELCRYARADAILRAGREILRRQDGTYSLRGKEGGHRLSARQLNSASVSAKDLVGLCLTELPVGTGRVIVADILLLLEASEIEMAKELAAKDHPGLGDDPTFLISIIDGWRSE